MTSPALETSPPAWARAVWSAFEPFTLSRLARPEVGALLESVGLPGRAAILVLRAAPLGRAHPAVIRSALHGFSDEMIGGLFAGAYAQRSPEELVAATHPAVEAACAERYGDLADRVTAVSELLVPALEGLDTSGRPLAAANAAIELPSTPFARLWRQFTLLREYRGDGHIAALTAAAIDRVEAQVLIAGWGADHVDVGMLRASRQLDDLWDGAVARLAERGLAEADGGLTEAGRALREDIEARTDEAAAAPYRKLGDHVGEVYALAEELSRRTLEGQEFIAKSPVGAPWPPHAPAA